MSKVATRLLLPLLATASAGAIATPAAASSADFLGGLSHVSTLASTLPRNGDVNPYGVAVVPRSIGHLTQGDVLVSNFNARSNEQGTGTSIVEISPTGARRTFASVSASHLPGKCPGGIGLTTALVVFRAGWVVVGSLPTSDGTAATAQAGCLLVLNSSGKVVETLSGQGINGPWDATAADLGSRGIVFVSNVLNGTVAAGGKVVDQGTVLRLTLSFSASMPKLTRESTVASGLAERTDPAALVVGPTGLALGSDDTLYLADTVNSRLAAIPHATTRVTTADTGATVRTGGGLNGPLGLVMAPNGHLLTVNAGDGNILEIANTGRLIATRTLDNSGNPPGAGALFGLAVTPNRTGVYFVDDATNKLRLLH